MISSPHSSINDSIQPDTRLAIDTALADAERIDLSWVDPWPSDDGWTLAPDALRFLASLVRVLKPRHILELGSGLSTRVLAHATSELEEPCYISSIDHDPEFGAAAARSFSEESETERVRFQIAPLVAREYAGKLLPVYLIQPERLASPLPVDLVVVDGPTVVLGGREGTLYQVMDSVRPGAVLILDDAARKEEQLALSHWRESLGDAIEIIELPHFTKGMAAVIVHRTIKVAELWAHRMSLTLREIEMMIPRKDTFIVVGNSLWGEALANRSPIPFIEHEGQYWGPPADDGTGIRELERLRQAGAAFILFGWLSFWWLDYYRGFSRYLRDKYRCVLENDRLVAFDLRRNDSAAS
jgi:predicted O-methyltransferase YrrM